MTTKTIKPLEVGDEVAIRADSEFYPEQGYHGTGKIIRININGLYTTYDVRFPDDYSNAYYTRDLITIAERAKIKPKFKIGQFVKVTSSRSSIHGMIGLIVCLNNEYYGVEFPVMGTYFNTLEGKLEANHGSYFLERDLELAKTNVDANLKIKDYKKRLMKLITKSILVDPRINIQNTIDNRISDIRYLEDEFQNKQRRIVEIGKEVEQRKIELKDNQKLLKKTKFDFEKEFKRQMLSIKKHPLVKSLSIAGKYLVVTTKDLVYTPGRERYVKPYNLGAFKIYVTKDYAPIVINYTKHYRRGDYHHPCVEYNGTICTGSMVGNLLEKYRREGNIDLIIFLVITFLQKPDYGTPFLESSYHQFAQPRVKKFKWDIDYLSRDLCRQYETWDDNLHEQQIKNWEETKMNPIAPTTVATTDQAVDLTGIVPHGGLPAEPVNGDPFSTIREPREDNDEDYDDEYDEDGEERDN